jgi:hypothetical protein
MENQNGVIERPRTGCGYRRAFSGRPTGVAHDPPLVSGLGFYPALRKPKSCVDDLAGVVRQEFDVVKTGEGSRYGDGRWTCVLGTPLRLAIYGKEQVAFRPGQPVLTPVAAGLVVCCIRWRGQPNDHNRACIHLACRPPMRDGTAGTTMTERIFWRDSRCFLRCLVNHRLGLRSPCARRRRDGWGRRGWFPAGMQRQHDSQRDHTSRMKTHFATLVFFRA